MRASPATDEQAAPERYLSAQGRFDYWRKRVMWEFFSRHRR
jgi:hypothetical protein